VQEGHGVDPDIARQFIGTAGISRAYRRARHFSDW